MTDYYVPWFLDRTAAEPQLLAPAARAIDAKPGAGDQLESVAPIHRAIADQVAQSAAAGGVPKLVLGDCCQVIPVMAGLARAGIHPTLIWLDSHGDFNTWETTPSKFLGGMPLAMLTGRGDQRMMQAVGLAPMPDERVVLSDARDLDPGERDLVQSSRLRHVEDMRDLLAGELPEGPLYVHFDTDLLDSTIAPAFLYAVPGGPSPQDVAALLDRIKATGRMVAVTATAAWDSKRPGAAATLAAASAAWSGAAAKG
jgi:arginase